MSHKPDYILQNTTSSADKGGSREIICLDFCKAFDLAQQNNLMKFLKLCNIDKYKFKKIKTTNQYQKAVNVKSLNEISCYFFIKMRLELHIY